MQTSRFVILIYRRSRATSVPISRQVFPRREETGGGHENPFREYPIDVPGARVTWNNVSSAADHPSRTAGQQRRNHNLGVLATFHSSFSCLTGAHCAFERY